MRFRLHDGEATHSITLEFGELINAGITGRDVQAVQAHIDELAEIGVPVWLGQISYTAETMANGPSAGSPPGYAKEAHPASRSPSASA